MFLLVCLCSYFFMKTSVTQMNRSKLCCASKFFLENDLLHCIFFSFKTTYTLGVIFRYFIRLLFLGICFCYPNCKVLEEVLCGGRRQRVLVLVYKSSSLYESQTLRNLWNNIEIGSMDSVLQGYQKVHWDPPGGSWGVWKTKISKLSGAIDQNLENYHIFQSVFVSPLDESSELLKLVCLMERTKIGTESTYSRMQGRSHISVFFWKLPVHKKLCVQSTWTKNNFETDLHGLSAHEKIILR